MKKVSVELSPFRWAAARDKAAVCVLQAGEEPLYTARKPLYKARAAGGPVNLLLGNPGRREAASREKGSKDMN